MDDCATRGKVAHLEKESFVQSVSFHHGIFCDFFMPGAPMTMPRVDQTG